MKLFGMRAGLLGGLFNRGGGSDGEPQDEASSTADRLSRIKARGRGDTPPSPYASAVPPEAFVPPPGHDEPHAEAPLDLDRGYHDQPFDAAQDLPQDEQSWSPEAEGPSQEQEQEQAFVPHSLTEEETASAFDPEPLDLNLGIYGDNERLAPESDHAAAPVQPSAEAGPIYGPNEGFAPEPDFSTEDDQPVAEAHSGEPEAAQIYGPDEGFAPEPDFAAGAAEPRAFDPPAAAFEEGAFAGHDAAEPQVDALPLEQDFATASEHAPEPALQEEPVYEDYSEPAYSEAPSGEDAFATLSPSLPAREFMDEPRVADDFMAEPPLAPDCNHLDDRPRIMPTMRFATDDGAAAPAPDFMAASAVDTTGEFAIVARKKKVSSLGLSPMVPGEEPEEGEEAGDRSAILFRQIFPPPHDNGLSFFGGVPIASPDFEWPCAADGVPYSFIMQLDCTEVPAHARRGLSDSGILYVFMRTGWGNLSDYRVIHEDAAELVAIDAPEDLPPIYGEETGHLYKWPRADQDQPRLLPKWRFRPVAVDLAEDLFDEPGEDGEESPILWPSFGEAGERVNALIAEAQGETIVPDHFTMNDFDGAGGSLIRPWHQFPHDARAIQIMSGLLLERLGKKHLQIRSAELDAMSAEDREQLLQRIQDEAQGWYDDAAAEAPFIEVPQEVADQYWDWLCAFPWLARFVLGEALTLSIEESLAASPEAAARVPAEIAAKVKSRHALALTTERGLHVNIPDRMIAPPVDVQGNQYERAKSHVLLFEMSSNEGLGHHFGEGVYQFWIKPEDLEAGRFDKVELTADAY